MGFDIFGWFTRDRVKVLEGMAKTIARLFLGRLAESAWEVTKDSVWRAEQSGLPGDEKFELAYKEIKATLMSPSVGRWILSCLIELAVGVMRASKGLI